MRFMASKAVCNLPSAHHVVEFWREWRFRRTVNDLVHTLYNLEVDGFSDEDLDAVLRIAYLVHDVVSVHVGTLRVWDNEKDAEEFKHALQKLQTAIKGLEQGLAPDPARRPSDDQLLDRFADLLRRQPLNLSDHTDCAPANTA